MRIIFAIILGFSLLAPLSADSAESRALKHSVTIQDGRSIPLYSGYYAVVVGVGDYQGRDWPKLPNPAKDAREVADMLKALGFDVKLVLDPASAELKNALNSMVMTGKDPNMGVLFYYAGHGYTLNEADGTKLGYIVPKDAPDPEKDQMGFMDKAFSMRRMEEYAKLIQSKHVLMVFDSCFSGALFSLVRDKPSAYIEEKITYPVRQFITAGLENEQVPDKSVFKDVFVQGVRDGFADLNRDGYVTGEELGYYLQEKVVNYSGKRQHPQFGKINNPKLDKGDFVFVAKAAGTSAAEAPIPPPSPKGPSGGSKLSLDDIEKKAKETETAKAAWGTRLKDMEADFGRVKAIEGNDVPNGDKAAAWQMFLDAYAEDNPYSDKDNSMRSTAEGQIRHWRSATQVAMGQRPQRVVTSPWVATTIDSAGDVGEHTSIALDSNNKVHISYRDETNEDLKYATNASGSWNASTIDSAGYVGDNTSIALDSNNKAHISYSNSTNDDLKYATNASGAWVATTIDSAGAVGESTSIALDSNNKAHISYYDATNGDLKYATNAAGL